MTFEDRDIAALVSSRICHDLISPLGAISNGLELISLTGSADTPELALIRDSVENANARIRFFRIAFGAASFDAEVPEAELRNILNAQFSDGRIRAEWAAQGAVKRREAKLVYLAILCAASALPWGGDVVAARGPKGWSVRAKGAKLRYDADLWDELAGLRPRGPGDPAKIQFGLLRDLTTGRRPSIKVAATEQVVELTF